MNIISRMYDNRISAESIIIEIKYKEYLKFATEIIKNNELQRKKVNSSKTVYSLLKDDLKQGCIIPPIVLAISDGEYERDWDDTKVLSFIEENLKRLLILDGLQRTYTLIRAQDELIKEDNKENIENFGNRLLRLEIYLGINKFGILYRMLTLNTGQTPMSVRHQIEILYKDFNETKIEGVELIPEVDKKPTDKLGVYNFRDIIEGFNSYIERNELPLDKVDILQNIKSLEKLSFENQKEDLFKEFVQTYNKLVIKFDELTEKKEVTQELLGEYEINSTPFGKNVIKIFNRSQALTGFGAAVGKLKDFKLISSIRELEEIFNEFKINDEDKVNWMYQLLKKLDKIKDGSKKIGNSQRMFFQYFFRELFNKESDSYLDLELAVENGYNKYYSQVS